MVGLDERDEQAEQRRLALPLCVPPAKEGWAGRERLACGRQRRGRAGLHIGEQVEVGQSGSAAAAQKGHEARLYPGEALVVL